MIFSSPSSHPLQFFARLQDKAAAVAIRFGGLGGLLDAYSDPSLPEAKRRQLLVGSTPGTGVGGGGRTLGAQSSLAVYKLMSKQDPEEVVDAKGGTGK